MLFEHRLVVPDGRDGVAEGDSVGLALGGEVVEAAGQERVAPGGVAFPVGSVEELIEGQDAAGTDEGPVIKRGVGELRVGAFEDAPVARLL